MKIVIAISHSFCANFIKGQATFLKDTGCEVIIISAHGPEVTKIARDEGVRLVEIPFSREIALISDLKCFFKVIRFLKLEKPDLVNAGNPKTGFLFMLARIFYPSIPMVFTLRGLRSDTLKGIKRQIVFFTEWISCVLAKRVIVISPSLKEHAIKLGILKRSKAIVLGKGSSNGVDTEKFNNDQEKRKEGEKIREQYDIQPDDIVIGYVGRITKDKGVEELYKAFKICQEKQLHIKLLLTGPVEKDDLISETIMAEMLSDPDVFFLGNQSNVENIYAAYDMLVLYSYREGFGNVVLEASSMGRPVIVSDIPGLRDTTEHMKSGLLVTPKDSIELSKAIQFYIDNPDVAKEHGAYGAQRAKNFFSADVIWNGQYDLYKKLVR